ncbi:FMN-dependent NADH-azoreductase [Streptococcus porcorum]|uniref:FMN dependent NADH:quinone oxidoreductase n=1 Tax=Streptococcus porcorum TaxID=701526 RepID=A0ABV2JD18_9STRE
MAKVLFVKGHPLEKEQSYSLKAFEAFKDSYQSLYPDDEIIEIDVYDGTIPSLDKELLEAMSLAKKGGELTSSQADKLDRFNHSTETFLSSDKVVIANPLWNLQIPSHLLSWINTITVAGKTFKYTPNGVVGRATDKKLLHIQANGGLYNGQDTASQYIKSIFNFIGIDSIQSVYVEGHAYQPDQADDILNQAINDLKEIAKTF